MNEVTSNSTHLSVGDLKPGKLTSQRNVLVLKNVFCTLFERSIQDVGGEGDRTIEVYSSAERTSDVLKVFNR